MSFNISNHTYRYKGEFALKSSTERSVESYQFTDLSPATEYTIAVKSVCVFDNLKVMHHLNYCVECR